MSNSYNYNPIPPRVWSRVQDRCTYVDSSNNAYYQSVFIPLPAIPFTQQPMPLAEANYQNKLLYKGNILQYKGNSSQLTKKQKYTQLAKGFGPSRTKVFATQTQTYTNPNTTGLQRVNYTTFPFPNTLVGKPNNISGPFQYAVPNPNGCLNPDGTPSTAVQDGGTLVCGTLANPCTGELIKANNGSAAICNPASASDVPGTSFLCWNRRVQTWFPRQRYVMNNSGTKWPEGYKGFVSAIQNNSPILTASATCSEIMLNWIPPKVCASIAVTGYNIYVNNSFYASVSPQTTSYEFLEPVGSYVIYIEATFNAGTPTFSNIIKILITPGARVISEANIKATSYNNLGYSGLIIETTLPPSTTGTSAGTAVFTLCAEVDNVSLLIVGGGGGGSSGYNLAQPPKFNSGGAGGGGGGVTYVTGLNTPTNVDITIKVGAGGGIRACNEGQGEAAGYPGVASSVSIPSTSLTSGGGGPGYGVGSVSLGGGFGGSATTTGSSGGTDNGYGGGGGGGAYAPNAGANASNFGPGGTGYTANGSNGTVGGTVVAGNGGAQFITSITPGFQATPILISGGGGGGGSTLGGLAGHGSGGTGNAAPTATGQSASNYGSGGGGGSLGSCGGTGGSGVFMIWWPN
jgi:hypothetical protein